MHCGRFTTTPLTRRQMLAHCANGFGAVAATALLAEWNSESLVAAESTGALSALHHAPRARNVIFLYMDGGPGQMDTFDPKPLLNRQHGQPFKMKIEPTQFNNNGTTFGSPWKFA